MKHTENFLDTYKARMEQGEDSMALGFELLFTTILDLATDKDKSAMEVA